MNDSSKLNQVTDSILNLVPNISSLLTQEFNKLDLSGVRQDQEDVVSKIDHQVGQLIIDQILTKYPEVSLDSEETEERQGDGNIVIRLDPVDGSKYFVSKVELFTSTLSLSIDGRVDFGLVILPFSKRYYHATRGLGTYVNETKLQVGTNSITENFLFIEFPTSKLFKENPEKYEKHIKIANKLAAKAFRVRSIGCGSLSIAWLAQGSSSAYIDLSGTTKLYDIEGALLLASEAGATVGTIEGRTQALSYSQSEKKELRYSTVIGNSVSYPEIQEILKNLS